MVGDGVGVVWVLEQQVVKASDCVREEGCGKKVRASSTRWVAGNSSAVHESLGKRKRNN